MRLFGITGSTLNHTARFETEPVSVASDFELSSELTASLSEIESEVALSAATTQGLSSKTVVVLPQSATPIVEFGEMNLDLGGPGVDAKLTIDLEWAKRCISVSTGA